MPPKIESISPWVPGNDEWERSLHLASSYAEAAEVLCNAMLEDEFTRQHTSVMVIRYLCRHAAELYFKGALGMKGDPVPRHHHLDKLQDLYRRAYPEEMFHFSLPIEPEILAREDLFADDELTQIKRVEPERFRYAADKTGDLFKETRDFDIPRELELIANLKSGIHLLGYQIANRFKKVYPVGGLY